MSNAQAALVEAQDALELAKMNGGAGLTRGELQEIADAIASVRAALAQAAAAQPVAKDLAAIDWRGHGLSWALADSLYSMRGDDWTADDIASAYEAGAKVALRLASIVSLTPDAPQPAEAAPTADLASENAELRHLLAVRVAGALLYVDDGELSDASELPAIDFKRDAPGEIARKLTDRGLKKLTKPERVHALVNAGPYPGMSEAFDAHMGAACWTDPAYAPDASMWAAAWKAAKAQPVAVPQGFALVPVVPTDAMVLAAFSSIPSEDADPDDPGTLAAWERMLNAAPAAQPQQPAP